MLSQLAKTIGQVQNARKSGKKEKCKPVVKSEDHTVCRL